MGCVSEVLFGYRNLQELYVVKKSLVDRKVEYDTPAKQKHLVCVNTVKDLSESTRSVAKEF